MSQPWDYIAKLVCIGDSGTGKSSLTIRLCEGRFSTQHDVTIGVEFGSRLVPVGPPASLALNINNPTSSKPTSSSSSSAKIAPLHRTTDASSNASTTINSSSGSNSKKSPSTMTAPRQKRMKLSLWDTAGQETYKSITRSYFRGASGALLVFDITRRATFESVTAWLADLRHIAEEGIVVVLVGNKADLASDSLVTSTSPATAAAESTSASASASAATIKSSAGSRSERAVASEEAREWCRRNGVMGYVETSAKSGEGVERAFLEVAERIYQNIEAGKYDLNDRRSGVKGPGAGGGGRGTQRANGAVVLGMNEVGGMGMGKGRDGCC